MKSWKRVASLFGIVGAALLSACGVLPDDAPSSQKQALTIQSNSTYEFSTSLFRDHIKAALTGGPFVKGYSVVLMHGQNVVTTQSGGWAQFHYTNPNVWEGLVQQSMSSYRYANVGSVAKFPTGIALLAVMEKKSPYVQAMLDFKIWPYLPKPWRDLSHHSIQWITFRDLLSHRSGFIKGDNSTILDRLKAGVDQMSTPNGANCTFADGPSHFGYCHGVRTYNNDNFRLLGYLIPIFSDTTLLQLVANKQADDKYIEGLLGQHFESILRTHVFQKITPVITPTCDAPNDLASSQLAMMYTHAFDLLPGHLYSTKQSLADSGKVPHCRGQGGWYYSPRALGYLLGTLETTDAIISRTLYKSLFNPEAGNTNARLVWAGQVINAKLQTRFGWNWMPSHGGDHPVTLPGGRKVYGKSAIVRLPLGYSLAGVINSDGMDSSDISQGMVDAFANAWTLKARFVAP